jgi:non-ribosomal peptide synthetase component F
MTVVSGISSVPDMARVWSSKTPDKAALIDGGRVVTYAQLNERSNRIANTLIAAGIQPGSPVQERSQQFFDKVDRGRAGATTSPP